jgi:HD-GYP domain-containing protein (c-di-GMP phosphodiesterase class II)
LLWISTLTRSRSRCRCKNGRKALPHIIACGEMERCSGTQFDPDIVRVFLGHIEDYRKLEAAAGKTIPR